MSNAARRKAPGTSIKCWLKFAPQHSTTRDGSVTLNHGYRTPGEEQGEMRRMMRYIRTHIANEKIWQARIYKQPGNLLVFQWDNMNGATTGRHLLDIIEFEMTSEEVIDELQGFIDNAK